MDHHKGDHAIISIRTFYAIKSPRHDLTIDTKKAGRNFFLTKRKTKHLELYGRGYIWLLKSRGIGLIISTSSLARKKVHKTALFHDLPPQKRFLDLGTRIVWPTFLKLSVLTETSSNAHVHDSHAMFTFKMLFVLYLWSVKRHQRQSTL